MDFCSVGVVHLRVAQQAHISDLQNPGGYADCHYDDSDIGWTIGRAGGHRSAILRRLDRLLGLDRVEAAAVAVRQPKELGRVGGLALAVGQRRPQRQLHLAPNAVDR